MRAIRTQPRLSVGIDGSLTVMKETYDGMYTRWLLDIAALILYGIRAFLF